MKAKTNKDFFNKKIKAVIKDLGNIKTIAEDEKDEILYSTKQYSLMNSAIELTKSSWDVLLQYDSKLLRKIKITIWNWKFKKLLNMYNSLEKRDRNELVKILTQFITFLEKEQRNNE